MLAELNASGSCNVRVCVPLDNLFFCTNRYPYIRCNSFFKSFLKNLAYLPLCCPVQMEGLAFRMYYHQIVRIDIYPCVKKNNKNSENTRPQPHRHTSPFQALGEWERSKKREGDKRGLGKKRRSRSSPAGLFDGPPLQRAWNRLSTKQSGRLNTTV